MSPSIILRDDKLWMVTGASGMMAFVVSPDIPLLTRVYYVGGARIITAVLQVFLNVLLGDDMYTATSRPRMHHQLVPPGVVFYSRLHSTSKE